MGHASKRMRHAALRRLVRMIVFVRSYVADFDARLGKYFDVLADASVPFRFLGWCRDGAPSALKIDQTLFHLKARLGGGWRNALALVRWNAFILWQLYCLRHHVRVVHAIDLDSAMASWVFCKLFRKRLVFDIYDKYTAVRSISGAVGRALDAIESSIAKSADLTLIVSEQRFAQHGLSPQQANVLVLENVPVERPVPIPTHTSTAAPWKLGYFGVLEPHHRGLEDLLRTCMGRADVTLHVAGYGGLAPLFQQAATEQPNVFFHGAVSSAQGLALMADMDVVVGLYYLTVPNHAYASPNKYYEHLMLGRGMLTTVGTPPSVATTASGSGWSVAEGQDAIARWLDRLDAVSIANAGIQAKKVWQEKYVTYYTSHYRGEYVGRIKSLIAVNPSING